LLERLRQKLGSDAWAGAEGIAAFARETLIESPDSPEGEIPFEPFDYQVEFWQVFLEECARLDRGEKTKTIHDEKSRQMGMSWAAALLILWCLTFWRYAWRGLVLSYNEDLVDDGGQKSTTDSLFGKVRFMHDRMPANLQAPLDFRLGRIVNRKTGAAVIGKSTNPASKQAGGGGRGGSYRFGFWDEAAFGAHSFQVWAGFRKAARVRVLWSTPNGKSNIFAWLRFKAKGGVRFLRQHWTCHPEYSAGAQVVDGKWWSPWYEQECQDMTEEDIARELDISYEASARGRALPEFSVEVHVRPDVGPTGAELFAGIDFGIRATTIGIYESRPGDGFLEIAGIAAMEYANATADIIAAAFAPWQKLGLRRIYGDPAGKARTQTTGTSIIDELRVRGVPIMADQRLRDVQRRVRTARLVLAGKKVNGRDCRFVMGSAEDDDGLVWLAECLEQCCWPTDAMGVVRGDPTDLADNEYTHHADQFTTALEGLLGQSEILIAGNDPAPCSPVFAGLRNRRF
jgi:hypothetical protein